MKNSKMEELNMNKLVLDDKDNELMTGPFNPNIPYSAKVKTPPSRGWSSNFGTRVSCQKLAPQRGA